MERGRGAVNSEGREGKDVKEAQGEQRRAGLGSRGGHQEASTRRQEGAGAGVWEAHGWDDGRWEATELGPAGNPCCPHLWSS